MPTSQSAADREVLPDAMLTRRAITAVTAVIAGLAFAVSLGDTAALGRYVGLAPWIRWLIGPMVDLSVVGLLIGLRFLALAGVPDLDTLMPRCLLALCGLLTLALNTSDAWAHLEVGTALVQTVAPCLLMVWSSVGPWLLRAMHQAAPRATADDASAAGLIPASAPRSLPEDGSAAIRASSTEDQAGLDPTRDGVARASQYGGTDVDLLTIARRLDIEHRAASGRPISRDALRARLHISRDRASELATVLRREEAQAARSAARYPSADAVVSVLGDAASATERGARSCVP